MKKLFPKKKKGGKIDDKTAADLKMAVNKIRMGIKKYEKTARDFQMRAKKAVQDGNIKLAKNYLLRRKRAMTNLQQFQGFIVKLERQQDAIDSADTIKIMGETMKSTTAVLTAQVEGLKPEEIMEMNEESEEAIANIEESAEIMSESLDSLDDFEIEDELEALKTEVMLEGESGLPPTPLTVDFAEEEEPLSEEEEATKSEQLKNELEKLKRELEL
ncbi:MAG: Snf7 family protein [Promethearchaeota archaeon]